MMKIILVYQVALILFLPFIVCSPSSSKVKDLGPKLPDLIEQNPNKNWLIEFYAPWCYRCQQIETIYNNVAEKIYHQHEHLIVGRVDCTEHAATCEKFGVLGFPTIKFLNNNTSVTYRGSKSVSAIIDFAERLSGPEVGEINDCGHLKNVVAERGHIVLSTEQDLKSSMYKEFHSLARSLRAEWWFYHFGGSCKKFVEKHRLYILKKHLNRAVPFEPEPGASKQQDAIIRWIQKESFPVYGEINHSNFDRAMAAEKMLVIAILDEYKPAKKFTPISRDFHKSFEELARKTSQLDNDLLFLWTSDLPLIESIALRRIHLPNVMILRSDYSFRLVIPEATVDDQNTVLTNKLHERSIKMHIAAAKLDDMAFEGGNTLIHALSRYVYARFTKLLNIYRADPLLVTILIVFPLLILLFVVYQTCFHENKHDDVEGELEDEELEEEEEEELLLNHRKQE